MSETALYFEEMNANREERRKQARISVEPAEKALLSAHTIQSTNVPLRIQPYEIVPSDGWELWSGRCAVSHAENQH